MLMNGNSRREAVSEICCQVCSSDPALEHGRSLLNPSFSSSGSLAREVSSFATLLSRVLKRSVKFGEPAKMRSAAAHEVDCER
jgi:hypothetical protein